MRVVVLDDDGSEMFNVGVRVNDASNCLFPAVEELNTIAVCLNRALSCLMPGLPGESVPTASMTVVDAVDTTKPPKGSHLRLVEKAHNDA